jgi:hypothetical protein
MTQTYQYSAVLKLTRKGKEGISRYPEYKAELILTGRDLHDIQRKILKTELEHVSLKPAK